MALFDFIKKKEFEEIDNLKEEIRQIHASYTSEFDLLNQQLLKYSAISDIVQEVERKKQELDKLITDKNVEINKKDGEIKELNIEYVSALEIYTRLRKETMLYENKLDLVEYGIYEPVYEFEKSDDY